VQHERRALIKAFGRNDASLADLPGKRSGVALTRIVLASEGHCSWCFPHGFDAPNSRYSKLQRCWKRQRTTQWKSGGAALV